MACVLFKERERVCGGQRERQTDRQTVRQRERERERAEDRETERETERDTHRENRDKSMVLSPGFVKTGAPACELENR